MSIKTISELVPLLQTSIGPVILISGIGLLLLSMTNRLGRTIDRARALLDEYESLSAAIRSKVDREIMVLWKRARYIRTAILLATSTCLGAATLIILLFMTSLFHIEVPLLIETVFIFSMLCLIVALVFFLLDVNMTLSALRIELEGHRKR
ncbi:MAG: DUF2721 domain-containing protein [Chlorobiaceae bacterium]|nr:DUF2721 domain-containing protein [Chlorobiaceae bacterium]